MGFREIRKGIFEETKNVYLESEQLKKSVDYSVKEQKIYWEGDVISFGEARFRKAADIVISKSKSVEAAEKYSKNNRRVCVLNFASSVSPGGGVTAGAQAQEESICRVSTLYFALSNKETAGKFYDRHWELIRSGRMNRRNTDDIIYTPGIFALRDETENENLLKCDERYEFDVITCAAPDIRQTGDETEYFPGNEELHREFVKRWKCILSVAAKHEADVLILGAFGCGVFANPPELVASAFCEAFESYRNFFETVEFAVYCGKNDYNYVKIKECLELKRNV